MAAKRYEIAKGIAVTNGEALIFNENNEIINSSAILLPDGRIGTPRRAIDTSRMAALLINSGSIRFEDNKAFLNFVIQQNHNLTVMWQLGKVAEAVVVKRCAEAEDVNYRLFCIATGKKARRDSAKRFIACGTSLIETKNKHKHIHNPQDTQRDIIFINSNDIPALMSNATTMAGQSAGLQIKISKNIIDYIVYDIVNMRYCVPIICFPLTDSQEIFFGHRRNDNDYADITIVKENLYDNLMRRILMSERKIKTLIYNNQEFFDNHLTSKRSVENRLFELLSNTIIDIRDIDEAAFNELLYAKDLLELLVEGRISPDDLIRDSDALRTSLLSLGLNVSFPFAHSSSVQTNNIILP